MSISTHWHFILFAVHMCLGLYALVVRSNLIKKVMGLNLVQVAAITFYVLAAKVEGGTAPIFLAGAKYSNPLPHVLMLTAIVVGIATTALGLSLIIRLKEAYGSIEEAEIERIDREDP